MRRTSASVLVLAAALVAAAARADAQEADDGGLDALDAALATGDTSTDPWIDGPAVPDVIPDSLAGPLALRQGLGPADAIAVSARPTPPASIAAGPVALAPLAPVDPLALETEETEGLRLGSLRLDASATSGLGASSATGAFVLWEAELRLATDWERHGLAVTLRGGEERDLSTGEGDPVVSATLEGRLDLGETETIDARASWSSRREDADSAEAELSGTRADVDVYSASLDYRRRGGLIGIDAGAAVDRSVYDGASGRDDLLLSGILRLTLDSGAVLQPFAEAGVYTRLPDADRDAAGYDRRSVGGELRAGLVVDTGLVSGEIAAGAIAEDFADERLDDIVALSVETGLAWTPHPLLTATLRGSTAIEPTTAAGASGSVVHAVDVGLAASLRPDLVADLGAGASYRDYVGIDRTVLTGLLRAGVRWRLDPRLELALTADHEVTRERGPGAEDGRETTVRATVTVRP